MSNRNKKDLKRRAKQRKLKAQKNKIKQATKDAEKEFNNKFNEDRTIARQKIRKDLMARGLTKSEAFKRYPAEEDNVF